MVTLPYLAFVGKAEMIASPRAPAPTRSAPRFLEGDLDLSKKVCYDCTVTKALSFANL